MWPFKKKEFIDDEIIPNLEPTQETIVNSQSNKTLPDFIDIFEHENDESFKFEHSFLKAIEAAKELRSINTDFLNELRGLRVTDEDFKNWAMKLALLEKNATQSYENLIKMLSDSDSHLLDLISNISAQKQFYEQVDAKTENQEKYIKNFKKAALKELKTKIEIQDKEFIKLMKK